jgi:hypothetical protein
MKRIALIALFLGLTWMAFAAQGNTPSAMDDFARRLELAEASRSCKTDSESGKTVCETTLANSVSTGKSKAGDHISLRTYFSTNATEPLITLLEGTIIEVRSRGKNQQSSLLRVRIDKAVRKDRQEFPVEARIVALASPPSVKEGLDLPTIIVDRFPRVPEDDERQPGERKVSDEERRTSPLDSVLDLPSQHRVVCDDKQKKASHQIPCSDLLTARGVYGYKAIELEPAKPDSPAESVLTSKRSNITFKAGTVLVLEIEKLPSAKSGVQ